MNSIKLTYINYVQIVIKFMSSDFFVWCFIVVNFEEIWTRPYRDVLVWRTKYNKKWSISTLREKYINWNWLDEAWGRFCRDSFVRVVLLLYEMSIFSKDVVRVGFKVLIWWFERNMLVCFFRLLTEIVSGFAFITKFSTIFVRTSPGALTFWKLMCWICWHPRVRLKFYVRFFFDLIYPF